MTTTIEKKSARSQEIDRELARIASENGGILRPEKVLEEAQSDGSPLHECFEWDESEAAHQYRLWQARQLINVRVAFLPGNDKEKMRVYVSLQSDRLRDGGGYRTLVSVMSNKKQREELLAQALREAEEWAAKYRQLSELAGVFDAIKKMRRR